MIARALQNKIAWSTLVQYGGKLLQVAMGIFAVKLASNGMGLAQFGLTSQISEYALFFATAANLGIFGNTVRKMSEDPDDGKLFLNAMVVRLGTGLLFLAVGFLYAWLVIRDPIFLAGALFFMSSLFFDFAVTVCTGVLQANYQMGRSVHAILMGRIFEVSLLIHLINAAKLNPETYFLAPLLGSAIALTFSFLYVRKSVKLEWSLDTKLMKFFLLSALPFGFINIFNSLYFRFLPDLFASKALSLEQFSQFHLSNVMAQTGAIFSTFLMFSTLPALRQALSEKHPQQAKELYQKARRVLLITAPTLFAGGILLGPWALQKVSSPEFYSSEFWYFIPALFLIAALSFFYDLILIVLFALERELWQLKLELATLAIATAIMAGSLLMPDLHLKMGLVFGGGIMAQVIVITLGTRKIADQLK